MQQIFHTLKNVLLLLCVIAFFINIGLFVFSHLVLSGNAAFELAILSLGNMMLLSFALLREPKPK